MLPIIFFLSPFVLSLLLTPLVRRVARRFGIFDRTRRTPLLGGVAVFVAFFLAVVLAFVLEVDFSQSGMKMKHLVGLFVGATLLMIGGILDDRFNCSPKKQIIWPIFATLVVIASGIGITHIANPFGGPLGTEQIFLTTKEFILFWFQGVAYKVTLFADVFTFVWLMGMMYTTKFLDGLDGLVSTVTVIGAVIIAALAFSATIVQRETALLALILAGAFLGFLVWNWHPAKIFLGEGGSLLAGFLLGTLAIISDSKVAVTVLIFGIPILDVAWVIIRRLFWERRSPLRGDAGHLHFRLLQAGLSHRQAVLVLSFFAAYFGIAGLFLQSRGQLFALVILSTVMVILGSGLVLGYWVRRK